MKRTTLPKNPADFHTKRLEHFDKAWSKQTLSSGLTLLHVPQAHDDHFFLGVMLKAGSRLEKGKHSKGVSHFLEHMMFRGSATYPEFTHLAEAFEWLGGEWNAATGHEHTEYWYAGIRHTAGEVIELFADFMAHPQLTDIEVERQIILRELDGETNDHGHSTDLDYHIATLLWPHSTMAQPILGTRDSLAKIDKTALHRYRDAFYVPNNMAICAVGGDASLRKVLAKHFGPLRQGFAATPRVKYAPLPKFVGPAVKWVEHSDNEYEIKLSFLGGPACHEWSRHAQPLQLLTRILADGFCSRLAKRLREELGLVYDIDAHTTLGLDNGTLDISASCAQDQLDEFLRELFALLQQLRTEGPTASELQRAIVRTVVDMELAPASSELMGTRLPWAQLADRQLSLAAERDSVKAVSVASVASLCRRLMRPETTALVVMGPSGRDIEKRMKKAIIQGLTAG